MKITPRLIQPLALAIVAVLFLAASQVGWPVEGALSGLALLPLAMGNVTMVELKDLALEQAEAFEQFKIRNDGRLKTLEDHLRDLEKKAGRSILTRSGSGDDPSGYKTAFLAWARSGNAEREQEAKSLSIDSDPNGGLLVPTEIDANVTRRVSAQVGMRRLANVVKVGSQKFTMLHRAAKPDSGWVGERQTRPETDGPEFEEREVIIGEVYANPAVTQALLDDNVFNLEQFLEDDLSETFADAEGEAFITGNGINKPVGILNYTATSTADATRSNDYWQYVASGDAGAFASSNPSDKLIKLVHALHPKYRANATWVMNSNTLEQIRTFKEGTTGNYLWKPGLENGQPDTLLGYPLVEDEFMPDIAANTLSIAFGDFKRGYTIADRNMRMLRDPYTNKPFVQFYTSRRVGGAMRDNRAIKFLKFAAS